VVAAVVCGSVGFLAGWQLRPAPVAEAPPAPRAAPRLTLAASGFADLPGWSDDAVAEAVPALIRSCRRLLRRPVDGPVGPDGVAGTAGDWQAPCRDLSGLGAAEDAVARRYFEDWFVPVLAADNGDPEGLFTGYYEPELRGARRPGGPYTVPLYRRPPGLISVDLGKFRPDLAGLRIAGKVVGSRLAPFDSRADIERGALAGRGLELVWVDDSVDAFFLHVQGSGRVRLDDGTVVRVGYDGTNDRPFLAVGRILLREGLIERQRVSMQAVRDWLRAHPQRGREIMARNGRYVFFRELAGDGPIGAEGVALTPGRSLAVDTAFLPLGAPIWLDTHWPAAPDKPLRRLVVAQDTGAAITGPVRGDLFWGHGEAALAQAGRMRSKGRYYLLLPRAVAARLVRGS
jgi:membrane-bound lytic murein transglycosylase A